MFIKLFNAITNPESFWREIFKYGFIYKKHSPVDWFLFRQNVARECALRRQIHSGPVKKHVEEIFPGVSKSKCQVRFLRPNAYNLTWEEIVTISQLVVTLSPKKLFEFGTFDGRTTLHLALNSPDNAVIYTIDIKEGWFDFGEDGPFFKNIKIAECFLESSIKKKIVMLTGDSKQFDLSQFDGSIDFIFIDGDHSYAGVINDTNKAVKMVRPGGLIIWHDYLLVNDVTKAILDICKNKDLINLKGTSLVVWQKPLNYY